MRKRMNEDPAAYLARTKNQARRAQIRSGAIDGLFERRGNAIRPEVKALIEAALADRSEALAGRNILQR
jgi:hypothetical protein